MSTINITNQIEQSIAKFLPTTLTAVMAVEAASHSVAGQTKLQTVVNAVMAGTQAAEGIPIPSVSAIAGLANLLVTILNSIGIFKHGAAPVIPAVTIPAVTPGPAPIVGA